MSSFPISFDNSLLAKATPEEKALLLRLLEQRQLLVDQQNSNDLASFCRRAWTVLEPATEFKWNWHHDLICEYLTLVFQRIIRRLIINVPPQTSKSRIATVFYPCWVWARLPSRRFMCASYSGGPAGLSTAHSIERRAVLQSEWYQSTFPDKVVFSDFENQKALFSNNQGGKMIATSPGGTATGKGVHDIILDDLMNPQQADSDQERTSALNFIDGTLRSRLSDQMTGAIIIIEQRTNTDDPTGHVMRLEPESWTQISIPMEEQEEEKEYVFPISKRVVKRKKGELLQPNRFPAEVVASLRIGLGSRNYAQQYNQRPAPKEGIIFNPMWWKRDFRLADRTSWPKFLATIITVDCAFKDKAKNDFVSLHTVGVTDEGDGYWLSMKTEHLGFSATKAAIRGTIAYWIMEGVDIDAVVLEDAANASAVEDEMRHEFPMILQSITGGLLGLAYAVQPLVEAGKAHIPADAPWAEAFIKLASEYPAVGHDDDISAACHALRYSKRHMMSGVLGRLKQQAEAIKKADGEKPETEEEIAVASGAAQIASFNKTSAGVVFGAEKMHKPQPSNRQKAQAGPKILACPNCGNKGLARYGETVKCVCGWSNANNGAH
jgi:phage terminase large subunit-like protein